MRGGKEESFAPRQRTQGVIWRVQESLCFHHLVFRAGIVM